MKTQTVILLSALFAVITGCTSVSSTAKPEAKAVVPEHLLQTSMLSNAEQCDIDCKTAGGLKKKICKYKCQDKLKKAQRISKAP